MRILVVEDEPRILDDIVTTMGMAGYVVETVSDGEEAWFLGDTETYDLIILDLGLPGLDGLTVLKRWRAEGRHMPVLVLTARGAWSERVEGIDAGADDYLPKPFNPRELLARIRAVLRRQGNSSDSHDASTPEEQQRYHFGDFTLDLLSNALVRADQVIDLTPGDFALLEAFVARPNRILSRDALIELIKGYERSPFDRSIDVRVTRLRKKIEPNPEQPQYIRTIWGKGYMFTPQGNPV